tara:strand:+ start:949 stop:1179 length:231 start_codon:yes stop_codon:yes gene_type:complete
VSWKVWKWDGHYIQGELLSSHSSESAALKKAKKEIKYLNAVKEEKKDEIVIWLDGENGQPLGVITKKKRKKKKGDD